MKLSDVSIEYGEDEAKALAAIREDAFFKTARGIAFAIAGSGLDVYELQPCHGVLASVPARTKPVVVATRLNSKATPEEVKTFLDYFVRSVYARFVINVDTILEDGFIAVTGKIPFHFMNTVNIIARTFYEKPWKLAAFKRLVDSGIPEEVAFVVAFSTKYGSRDYTNVIFETAHCPLSVADLEYLENFFNGVYPEWASRETFFDGGRSYYGGVAGWKQNGVSRTYDKTFVDKATQKVATTAFKNPFKTAMSTTSSYTREVWDGTVIPALVDFYKQVKNV